MPASYTISKINYSSPPSVNQVVTIAHKLTIDPDSSYVVDSSTVNVQTDGNLVSPFTITPLLYSTSYTVRVSNNCGGAVDTITFTTPSDPCPAITGIIGTVANS